MKRLILIALLFVSLPVYAGDFPSVIQNGIGASPWIPTAGLAPTSQQVDVTGTVNYTVQTTSDPLGNVTAMFNHPDTTNMVANTVSAQSNLQTPVRGIRLVINSGTGSAILYVGGVNSSIK